MQNSNSKILCNTQYIKSNYTIWIAFENAQRALELYSTNKQLLNCKNREEYRTKFIRTGQIALYREYKLRVTTADITVKTITIKATTIQTRLPEYNLTVYKSS